MCFDVSIPIRLICSTDGLLCLRSATASFWHTRCRRGPSTPTEWGLYDKPRFRAQVAAHKNCFLFHGNSRIPTLRKSCSTEVWQLGHLKSETGAKHFGHSKLLTSNMRELSMFPVT